jgi:glycerophosphoryl diester phosphodiesterase
MEFILIGHRGGVEFGPENTLETLASALEHGVTCIETDVRQTSDGVPVILHNPETNGCEIDKTPFSEVRSRHPGIPSLAEYMDLAAGRCRFNLEIKQADPAALLGALKPYDFGKIIFSSFNVDIVEGLRDLSPRLELGLLVNHLFKNSEAVDFAASRGFKVLLPFELMATRHLVERAHECGMKVIVWTVNHAFELDRLLEHGIDGIISDNYTTMRDHLEKKGYDPVDYPR